MKKIIILGPAHPLRGGIAMFNNRLANAFNDAGFDVSVYSFSLQYPSFLFPGKTQFSEGPSPTSVPIHTVVNSINPLNWIKVGKRIRREQPDIIVVRFWLPFMGPALGTILRLAKRNKKTKVICIADNIVPHEKKPGDKPFTRYFLKACDAVITMSEKVMKDLRSFDTQKPATLVEHPLYDNFGEQIPREDARRHLNLPQDEPILLFFGFIRKYKGVDILLNAVSQLQETRKDFKLVIAGEFYEDAQPYLDLIRVKGLSENVILHNHFIPDSEVKYYFGACDVVVQPYRNATQSGVTPLAYHFEKPMIVTDVGGLASIVPDGKVGIVTRPEPQAIAEAIERFLAADEQSFLEGILEEKKKYTWDRMVNTIISLA